MCPFALKKAWNGEFKPCWCSVLECVFGVYFSNRPVSKCSDIVKFSNRGKGRVWFAQGKIVLYGNRCETVTLLFALKTIDLPHYYILVNKTMRLGRVSFHVSWFHSFKLAQETAQKPYWSQCVVTSEWLESGGAAALILLNLSTVFDMVSRIFFLNQLYDTGIKGTAHTWLV